MMRLHEAEGGVEGAEGLRWFPEVRVPSSWFLVPSLGFCAFLLLAGRACQIWGVEEFYFVAAEFLGRGGLGLRAGIG